MTSNQIVLVRHGDDPSDDRVFTWLSQNGFDVITCKPFAGEKLPPFNDRIAGTVIYGGKYNVYETDQHPFLLEEYRWIETCLNAGVAILGICQGAQQIAWHLGAWAGEPQHSTHEFGYYEITATEDGRDLFPPALHVAQAHFHTFDLPNGAVCLAGNKSYPNQAVRFRDNVYGLQFHAEQTIEGFRRWQNAPWAAYGKPGAQTREQQNELMATHDETQAKWFYGFLEKLFGDQKQEPKPTEP